MVIGQCMICGTKNKVTIHHMKDIHSKRKKKKYKDNGTIHLCRDCHDVVEDIVNKNKSKRLWYHQGYQQGLEDAKQEEFDA